MRPRTFLLMLMALITVFLPAQEAMTQNLDESASTTEAEKLGFFFAHKVAGTYVMKAPDLPGINILFTFFPSGTLVATDSSDAGGGNPDVTGLFSPAHGVWKRSGPREIKVRFIQMHFLPEDGTHDRIEGIRFTATFDPEFNSFTSPFVTADLYGIEQDPSDPDVVPSLGSFGAEFLVVANRFRLE